MGLFLESELARTPLLLAAIAKLKPGQTTDVIRFPDPAQPDGVGDYAILQLVSREQAGQHDVSEPQVQQRIRAGLMNARSQLLKAAYFETLQNQATVENMFAEQVFKANVEHGHSQRAEH